MQLNKSQPNEPFWVDDPNPYSRPEVKKAEKGSLYWWISKIIFFYSISFYIVIIWILIIFSIKFPIFWIFVAIQVFVLVFGIFRRRFGETNQARAIRIQQHAKELTGADYLGSAIHTAGHPLLQSNQPVVLALKGLEFSIYSYENSTPLDTLSVKSITEVSPVVYDDEYVPHVGVIDNWAQALQISIKTQHSEYICSFRRMYKIRPIEWYQLIQKARYVEKAGPIGQI